MKFKYYESSTMAKLAWCAIITEGSEEAYVYHGSGVETSENFFVEGAWDGEFNLGNFNQSTFLIGTGARIMEKNGGGGYIVFSTPNHILERLYSITDNNKKYISNSLPLILYLSNSELDSDYLEYEMDFNSILKGLNEYKKSIPLGGNKRLNLYYYCNIILNSRNGLFIKEKQKINPFGDYKDYENRLIQTLRELIKNARSPCRKIKYGLVTTISKGYDATACAAIAKELGCDIAVTFNKPEKYAEDSGLEIARMLGYKNIIMKNANDYLENSSLVEAEFLSSGELGSGIIFTAFENEFRNNIVFVGTRGDKIWDKNRDDCNNCFKFNDEIFTGTSKTENRLRVGYISLPMPLFGASQWISIHNISNSCEMEPYSIGGDYDRPIPRRILETRGVPGSMFGMSKKGAGFNYRYDNLSRIKTRMSKKSFDSFSIFYKNNRRKGINIMIHWIKFLWNSKEQYIRYFLGKMGFQFDVNNRGADAVSNPGAPSYLFNWGVYEIMKRYKDSKLIIKQSEVAVDE